MGRGDSPAAPGGCGVTETEDERVRMSRAGYSNGAIARKLGMSRGSVWRYLKRQGIRSTCPPGRPRAAITSEDVQHELAAGKTKEEIAVQHGVSVATVFDRMQERES